MGTASADELGILGFFGSQNVGDDAFECFHREIFADRPFILQPSFKGEEGPRRIVFGGGNLINDFFLSKLPDRFEHLFLTSVALPHGAKDADLLLPYTDKIRLGWMRHWADVEALTTRGIDAVYYQDMVYAWSVPKRKVTFDDVARRCTLVPKRPPKKKTLVLTLSSAYWSSTNPDVRATYDRMNAALAAFLTELLPQWNVVFLPFHHYYGGRDMMAALDVVRFSRKPWLFHVVDQYVDPVLMYNLVDQVADVVISAKFHGTIYGIKSHTPTFALSRTKKVRNMMEDLGLEDLHLDFKSATTDDLSDTFDRVQQKDVRKRIDNAAKVAQRSAAAGVDALMQALARYP